MAEKIKGLTIEIAGDVAPLNKALGGVNSASKELQSELNKVEKLLKFDPQNTELLAQKQELLGKSIGNTEQKLKALKTAAQQAKEKLDTGEVTQEQYRSLQREIISTEQQLEKLGNRAKVSSEKMNLLGDEKINSAIQKVTLGVGVGLVGALGAAAVKAGVAADDINTLSKQTGLSTEEIQKFQYASDRIDVSMDTLTGSMAKLTKNMQGATNGSKNTQAAFDTLGVSITDSTGALRSNDDVFAEAIDALGKMENETQRDALAMQIFGKSAQDLNPLILGGADALKELGIEAEEAGLILSQDTLDAANQFADSVDELKAKGEATFTKIGASIAENLIPYIEKSIDMLDEVLAWIGENGETILGWIIGLGAALATLNVVIMIQKLVGAFQEWKVATEGMTVAQRALNLIMNANPIGIVISLIAGLAAGIVYLWTTNEDFRKAVIDIWNSIGKGIGKAIGVIMEPIDWLIEKTKDAINWLKDLAFWDNDKGSKDSKGNTKMSGMATGGTITRGTALVGENGTELLTMGMGVAKVTPLGSGGTGDLASEIANAVSSSIGMSRGEVGEIQLIVNIGTDKLADKILELNQSALKTRGSIKIATVEV